MKRHEKSGSSHLNFKNVRVSLISYQIQDLRAVQDVKLQIQQKLNFTTYISSKKKFRLINH